MIVSKDFIAGVRTGFKAKFDQLASKAPILWQQVATPLDSESKKIVQFNWLGTPPRPRPFKDMLEFGKSFPHDYQVTVTPYAVGLRIARDAFRRDPLGTIALHMTRFMSQAMKHKDYLIFNQMSLGFTTNGFDGVTFYNASHSIGDGDAWSNLETAQLSAEDPAAYNTAKEKIRTATDDQNIPLGLVPNKLVVSPDATTEYAAKRILKSTTIDGSTNVLANDMELVVSPYLTSAKEWHMLATDVLNPFILVIDEDFFFVPMDGLDSPNAFYMEAFEYKIFGQMVTGFGDPRQAFGSTGLG